MHEAPKMESTDANLVIRAQWQVGQAYRVPAYRYSKGKWQKHTEAPKEAAEVAQELRCVTWNVWMDDFNRENRYAAIMQVLEET